MKLRARTRVVHPCRMEGPGSAGLTGVGKKVAPPGPWRSGDIAGPEVFEICFQRKGAWFHLYVGRASDFCLDRGAEGPIFRKAGVRSAVAWSDQRLAYVLMGGGGAEALRSIL